MTHDIAPYIRAFKSNLDRLALATAEIAWLECHPAAWTW